MVAEMADKKNSSLYRGLKGVYDYVEDFDDKIDGAHARFNLKSQFHKWIADGTTWIYHSTGEIFGQED